MTFRWSFVRSSFYGGREKGENAKKDRDKGAGRRDRLFYGNTLVGHAEEEDEVDAEV